MSALPKQDFITAEEYLAGEELTDIRHEYLGGSVYAMAGTTDDHNIICLNLVTHIRSHLRGGPCRVFMESVKLRLAVARDDFFYYPDIMVTCDPRDTEKLFKRHPKLLIEVLSDHSERIDKREKFFSYTRIESLEEYVLVSQSTMEAVVFRRSAGWEGVTVRGGAAELRLGSIDLGIPLASLYDGVEPPPAR